MATTIRVREPITPDPSHDDGLRAVADTFADCIGRLHAIERRIASPESVATAQLRNGDADYEHVRRQIAAEIESRMNASVARSGWDRLELPSEVAIDIETDMFPASVAIDMSRYSDWTARVTCEDVRREGGKRIYSVMEST